MGFVFGIKSNWNPHAETWLQVAVEAAHFVQQHSFIKFLKHMFAFIAFTWNANLWMWLQALPVCLNGWCIWRKYSVFLAFKSCFQFMCVKLPSVSKWGGIALTDCSSEWASFIATQAYSTLCKSKTMKEVKSGETKTLTDEKNDSLRHQYATKSHYRGIGI